MDQLTKNSQIERFMQQLGISPMETDLYLKLLELGPSSVTDLAKTHSLPRTTVFENIDRLVSKGLITRTVRGRRKLLVAEDPHRIQALIDSREVELAAKQKEIEAIKNELPNFVSSIFTMIPKAEEHTHSTIKYYEGKLGVRSIYREVVKSNELRSYVNISKIFETFPENPQLFPENVEKGHLEMWEIIEDSPRSRAYLKTINPHKYHYKFFPKKWNISLFDYMVFNGGVAIITQDKEMSGILIQNQSIYENARVVFDMMWDLLDNPE